MSRDLWQALWVLGGLAFLGRAFVHDAWEPAGLSALCTVLALEVRQSRRAGGAAVAAGFLTLGLAYVTGDAGAFMVSTACATLAVLHLVAERSRTRRGAVSPAPSARFDVPDAADAAVAVSGTVADLRASVGVVVSGIVLLCFGLWHPSDALGTVLFGASCGCTVGAIGLWTAARGQTMTAEDARVLRLEQSSRLNWQAALVAARRAPSETVAGRRDLRSTRTDRADPPVC